VQEDVERALTSGAALPVWENKAAFAATAIDDGAPDL
jgi:hypothetical protein